MLQMLYSHQRKNNIKYIYYIFTIANYKHITFEDVMMVSLWLQCHAIISLFQIHPCAVHKTVMHRNSLSKKNSLEIDQKEMNFAHVLKTVILLQSFQNIFQVKSNIISTLVPIEMYANSIKKKSFSILNLLSQKKNSKPVQKIVTPFDLCFLCIESYIIMQYVLILFQWMEFVVFEIASAYHLCTISVNFNL